jgi:tetratricopeptide (TPR) repeat protein
MRFRLLLVILLTLLLIVIGGACLMVINNVSVETQTPNAPQATTKPLAVFANGHRNEAHWLADLVVAEMVRWATLWNTPAHTLITPINENSAHYRVSNQSCEFNLATHIWCPDDYMPVAQALLASASVSTNSAGSDLVTDDNGLALLKTLLQPTSLIMFEQDRLLTEKLKASPTNASLHEQAALLCVTMAFREAAGRFCDNRRELCAATAHLALAQATAKKPGPCGRVTSALVEVLANRQVSALAIAETLSDQQPESHWKKAIQLLATGNYKKYPLDDQSSMLEQLAHCRVITQRLGDGPASSWLALIKVVAAPDWGRIICETPLSVENGHVFAKDGIKEEFAALEELWQEAHQRPMRDNDLNAALTLTDGDHQALRVLSIGRWSAFLNRHLAHRLVAAHDFIEKSWGDHETSLQLRQLCANQLTTAPLMKMVRMQFEPEANRQLLAKEVAKSANDHPELLTAWIWDYLRRNPEFSAAKKLLPNSRQWWVDISPPGTAYHANSRIQLFAGTFTQEQEKQLPLVGALAPYDANIKYLLAKQQHFEDVTALLSFFGDLADLDSKLARFIGTHAKTSDERISAYQRLVKLDPNYYLDLANEYVKVKNFDEAVRNFESAYREATDRVDVANTMGWLVEWYADHNNMTRARVIADHGYEVFSYQGIEIKAKLDEQTNKLDEAESAWAAIKERYDDSAPLVSFWKRTASVRSSSKSAYDAICAHYFPKGLKNVQLSDFKSVPTSGIIATSESALSLQYGMKSGYVIVAIDNMRCENGQQYVFLRSLNAKQPLDIIVWNGKAYQQIIADVPNRKLNFDYDDYINSQGIVP